MKVPGIKAGRAAALLLTFAVGLHAQQRRYAVGSDVDVVSGSSNSAGVSATTAAAAQPFSYFYALYPSLRLTSTAPHNAVSASYAFGFNRTRTQSTAENTSHHATLSFSQQGPQWKISLTESFESTADANTFNALRGVSAAPEDPAFLVNSPVTRRLSRTNAASVAWDYSLSRRSSLSVSGGHNLRNYSSGGLVAGTLSNQQSGTGTVSYRRQSTPRESWVAGYTGTYLQFADFNNVLSHRGTVEFSSQFASGVTLRLTVGASRAGTPRSGSGEIGYETSVSLGKATAANSFSTAYTQGSGQSVGVGSVSQSRRASLNVSHSFKAAKVFSDLAVFDTHGQLQNSLNTRGASATANVGFPLAKNLSIQGGAQYQKTYQTTLGFTQRRVFVSLKFSNPEMWAFLK